MSDMHRPTDHLKVFNAEQSQSSDTPATGSGQPTERRKGFPALHLSAEMVVAPAFFIDPRLHVRWVASGGSDPISRILAQEHADGSKGTIFNLLTQPVAKTTIHAWQSFFSFIYTVLKRSTDSAIFQAATGAIEAEPAAVIQADSDRLGLQNLFSIKSAAIPLDAAASTPMRIYALTLPTGTLFLIRADDAPTPPGQGKMTAFPEKAFSPVETAAIWQLPMGALTVSISDAQRLAETMMPDTFFDLAKRIWQASDDAARSLGGKRVGINGGQVHYRFFVSAGRNPIFSAIICAVRLTRHIMAIQEASDVLPGWPEKITLQMGISCGSADATDISGQDGTPLIVPGDAIDQASTLAAMAGKEEIWITKTAVACLPKPLMEQLTMGIKRQDGFFRNGFSRVSELPWSAIGNPVKPLPSDLIVTRIFDIKPSTPESPDREKAIP